MHLRLVIPAGTRMPFGRPIRLPVEAVESSLFQPVAPRSPQRSDSPAESPDRTSRIAPAPRALPV